jgi:gliding motility-associated-like protein
MSAQQNLVPNGSFEDTIHCPSGSAEIYNARYFSSPTIATPDYFNTCADYNTLFSIPENAFGYQLAHTGNAYAGFVCYGSGSNYKEYIQTLLTSTLERDELYRIDYYLSLGNLSPFANNNSGILFSPTPIFLNSYTTIQNIKAVYSSDIISDTLNWVKLSFYYVANGNVTYLWIGNFTDDTKTDTIVNVGGLNDNYYFLDDISVTKIDYRIPNVFTPNGDGTNDVFYINTEIFKAEHLSIYNRWGIKVFESGNYFNWDGRTTSGETCHAGTYYYILQTETETYKGFLELVR